MGQRRSSANPDQAGTLNVRKKKEKRKTSEGGAGITYSANQAQEHLLQRGLRDSKILNQTTLIFLFDPSDEGGDGADGFVRELVHEGAGAVVEQGRPGHSFGDDVFDGRRVGLPSYERESVSGAELGLENGKSGGCIVGVKNVGQIGEFGYPFVFCKLWFARS